MVAAMRAWRLLAVSAAVLALLAAMSAPPSWARPPAAAIDDTITLTRNQNSSITQATGSGDHTPTTFEHWATGEQVVFVDNITSSSADPYRVEVPGDWFVNFTASGDLPTDDLADHDSDCAVSSDQWELVYYGDTGPRVGPCAGAEPGVLVLRSGTATDSTIVKRYVLFPDNDGGAPDIVTARPTNGGVVLTWDDNDGTPDDSVTGYHYRYKNTADGTWGSAQSTSGATRSVMVSSLTNGTSYDFQVRALYYGTAGAWSATEAATPDDELVSNISQSYYSYTAIQRNHDLATQFTTGDDDSFYYLLEEVAINFTSDYGTPQGNIVVAIYDSDTSDLPGSSIGTLAGNNPNSAGTYTYSASAGGIVLTADTSYYVVVGTTVESSSNYYRVTLTTSDNQAESSTGWDIASGSRKHTGSAWGNLNSWTVRLSIKGDTVAIPPTPDVPEDLTATRGHRSADLEWSAADGATGYDYRYKFAEGGTWGDAVAAGSRTSASVSDLSDGVEYDFQVRGTNVAVQSEWSTTASATPIFLEAFAWAETQDDLTYSVDDAIADLTLPSAAGGTGNADVVYSYTGTVPQGLSLDADTRVLSGAPDTAAAATTITWEAARTGNTTLTQDFTITVTADTAPGAPTITELLTENANEIRVLWTTDDDGGSGITGYEVQYCDWDSGAYCQYGGSYVDVGQIDWPHSGVATHTTITGLLNSYYDVRVRATNAIGTGPWGTRTGISPAAWTEHEPLGEGCHLSQPSLGVIPSYADIVGPYRICVPGASVLSADDGNSRFSLWANRSSLTCNSAATLSFSSGCHQFAVKGCGSANSYTAPMSLSGSGIETRTCVQNYGKAVSAVLSSSKYYETEPDWTQLESGLIMGQTRLQFVFNPTGEWRIWLPAAVAPWGGCTGDHKDMTAEEAAEMTLWPDAIHSGEYLLLEGCRSTKPKQLLAAPVTGLNQDPGVAVGVSGAWVQVAPEPLIDRGWLTTQLQTTVGVILFAVPLVVVPTIWGITRNAIIAGIATIALLLITSIVLQLPPWAYLSVLLAAAAAFLMGMLLQK